MSHGCPLLVLGITSLCAAAACAVDQRVLEVVDRAAAVAPGTGATDRGDAGVDAVGGAGGATGAGAVTGVAGSATAGSGPNAAANGGGAGAEPAMVPGASLGGNASAPPATGPVVAGVPGSIRVLLNAGVMNPTMVAVRDGVAFLTESQLSRIGEIGGSFKVVSVALNGNGLLNQTISLPGNDFFPEGMALDPVTNDLFIGSIFNGTIVRVADGESTPEIVAQRVPAVLQRGATGLKVDNVNNVLFVCDTNLGASIAGASVTGISLVDFSVVVSHEFPGATDFCNDLAFDAAGNLFVTETAVGQVFEIAAANLLVPNSLELFLATPGIAANGGFGANGLAFAGGRLFVTNTTAGTIVRFDPAAANVAATETILSIMEGGLANTLLSGPDGLLAISDTELLVVEDGLFGGQQNRLVLFTIDPAAQ